VVLEKSPRPATRARTEASSSKASFATAARAVPALPAAFRRWGFSAQAPESARGAGMFGFLCSLFTTFFRPGATASNPGGSAASRLESTFREDLEPFVRGDPGKMEFAGNDAGLRHPFDKGQENGPWKKNRNEKGLAKAQKHLGGPSGRIGAPMGELPVEVMASKSDGADGCREKWEKSRADVQKSDVATRSLQSKSGARPTAPRAKAGIAVRQARPRMRSATGRAGPDSMSRGDTQAARAFSPAST